MNYTKNKAGNWVLTFSSNINIEQFGKNHSQGTHKSTMELYLNEKKEPCMIQWDNPIDSIGMEIEFNGGEVTGYDGVFELPTQAIELLKHAGFKIEL